MDGALQSLFGRTDDVGALRYDDEVIADFVAISTLDLLRQRQLGPGELSEWQRSCIAALGVRVGHNVDDGLAAFFARIEDHLQRTPALRELWSDVHRWARGERALGGPGASRDLARLLGTMKGPLPVPAAGTGNAGPLLRHTLHTSNSQQKTTTHKNTRHGGDES